MKSPTKNSVFQWWCRALSWSSYVVSPYVVPCPRTWQYTEVISSWTSLIDIDDISTTNIMIFHAINFQNCNKKLTVNYGLRGDTQNQQKLTIFKLRATFRRECHFKRMPLECYEFTTIPHQMILAYSECISCQMQLEYSWNNVGIFRMLIVHSS